MDGVRVRVSQGFSDRTQIEDDVIDLISGQQAQATKYWWKVRETMAHECGHGVNVDHCTNQVCYMFGGNVMTNATHWNSHHESEYEYRF